MGFNGVICLLVLAGTASAQVCRLSVAGVNRNRRVMGPVSAECPFSVHSVPFGNWGVTSPFGLKIDGRQFEGWCNNTRVCDNNGNCSVQCRDGWYEWNSCTDHPLYRAPNDTLYNSESGTQQVSVTDINVHGSRTVDVPVSCPVDADADGVAESGGCASAVTYRSGVNFMSLYELDPGTTDDLIQTIYFPEAVLDTACTVWGCPSAATEWAAPIGYDSPTSPAKVYAEVAVLINLGMFVDTGRICRLSTLRADVVSAASYVAPVAPESIASAFGEGFAFQAVNATAMPLPTTLGGTTVSVTDSLGVTRSAPLFYVSPGQINFETPANTAAGPARVTVTRSDGISSRSAVQVDTVAPALFAANANGTGAASAIAVRVSADSSQTVLPVFECETSGLNCVVTPIDLGSESDQVILVLFGTGIRFGTGSVELRIGGVAADVLYAGAQGEYVGLDQVNVRLMRTLAGRGMVGVSLTVAGKTSNVVEIAVQ